MFHQHLILFCLVLLATGELRVNAATRLNPWGHTRPAAIPQVESWEELYSGPPLQEFEFSHELGHTKSNQEAEVAWRKLSSSDNLVWFEEEDGNQNLYAEVKPHERTLQARNIEIVLLEEVEVDDKDAYEAAGYEFDDAELEVEEEDETAEDWEQDDEPYQESQKVRAEKDGKHEVPNGELQEQLDEGDEIDKLGIDKRDKHDKHASGQRVLQPMFRNGLAPVIFGSNPLSSRFGAFRPLEDLQGMSQMFMEANNGGSSRPPMERPNSFPRNSPNGFNARGQENVRSESQGDRFEQPGRGGGGAMREEGPREAAASRDIVDDLPSAGRHRFGSSPWAAGEFERQAMEGPYGGRPAREWEGEGMSRRPNDEERFGQASENARIPNPGAGTNGQRANAGGGNTGTQGGWMGMALPDEFVSNTSSPPTPHTSGSDWIGAIGNFFGGLIDSVVHRDGSTRGENQQFSVSKSSVGYAEPPDSSPLGSNYLSRFG